MFSVQEVNLAVPDATLALRKALLNRAVGHDTVAADGPLFGGFAIPLANITGSVRDKVLADLTLSTFDGHAPLALTWTAAVLDETGEPFLLAGRLTIVPTGSATIGSQQVTGIALVGSDSVTLMGAKNLDAPVTVAVGSPLYLDVTLSLLPPVHPG